MSSDYHHGDLPAALRAAAVEVIAESGPGGFSLREIARRAGVSHAAPAHHFGDAEGLLTSVAAEGFTVLTENLRAAATLDASPRDRLIAMGSAYLDTALGNPGHYGVMIGHDYTSEDDEELMLASIASHDVLLSFMRSLRDEYNPKLDDLEVEKTATIVWASVHGLVELAPILGHVAEAACMVDTGLDALLERFADMVIEGMKP